METLGEVRRAIILCCWDLELSLFDRCIIRAHFKQSQYSQAMLCDYGYKICVCDGTEEQRAEELEIPTSTKMFALKRWVWR